MIDGSVVIYHIDITIQTENKNKSHAYQNIKNQSTAELIAPIEQMLVDKLRKYDDDIESDPEEQELEIINFYKQGGHKQEVGDLLTADDYPECAE